MYISIKNNNKRYNVDANLDASDVILGNENSPEMLTSQSKKPLG